MRRPLKPVIISGLFLSVVSALIYVFYVTELRARTEDELYDLRSRMAPKLAPKTPVVLVTIDEAANQSAALVGSMPWQTQPLQSQEADRLISLVERLTVTKARMIGVIVPPQFVSYDDPKLDKLAALAKADTRVVIGAFGHSKIANSEDGRTSRLLLSATDSLFRADIKRDFRRETIRKLILTEPNEYQHIAYAMAHRLTAGGQNSRESPVTSDQNLVIELNYAHKGEFIEIPASAISESLNDVNLTDAIILVGYTAFRPFTFDSREATYVNTPWQPEGSDLSNGIPVLHLVAIGMTNLIDGTYLRTSPFWLNLVQTLIMAVIALVAWSFEIRVASLIFVCSWLLLLVLHAIAFSFLHIHIPLADTALWSALRLYVGLSGDFVRIYVIEQGSWKS